MRERHPLPFAKAPFPEFARQSESGDMPGSDGTDGWTQSDLGRQAARRRRQQVGGPGSSEARAEADFEQGWLCPGLWFQFHDVTVQTCGLQAPAAAARPLARPPARPERPSPPHAETAARPLARPCAHQPPVSGRARPRVELSPAPGRRLCAALTQLVLGGGGGGRSHVAPGSERGRGGRPARGARGRRRAVSRRAVPQGPGAA